MKKYIVYLLALTVSMPLIASSLSHKVAALEYYCQKHYGTPHPFMSLLATLQLTEELSTLCQHTPPLAHHLPELIAFTSHAEPLVEKAICAFASDTDRPTVMRPLLDLSQHISMYINEHLREQAAQSRTVQKQKRNEKRMIETVLGVAIVGGALKYLILGALGISGLFVLDRIYKTLTNDVEVTNERIAYYRGQTDLAIRDTCVSLYRHACFLQNKDPNPELIQNRPSRRVRVKRFFGKVWRSIKRFGKKITPFMNPDTVTEPVHVATSEQARLTLENMEELLKYIDTHRQEYHCTPQQTAQIRGVAKQWYENHRLKRR